MSHYYYATRLSPRMYTTQQGFLICKDAVLCRTGEQDYRGSEVLTGGSDDVVVVRRPKSEVYDEKFLASLEGSPIVDNHPSRFVDAATATWSVRGHVQNVRPGGKLKSGEDCVIGDLFITDAALIEKILRGHKRELSVGYDVRYLRNADGTLTQTNLRANHVAVVPNGRAGSEVRIYDAAPEEDLEISVSQGEDDMASRERLRESIKEFIAADPEEIKAALLEVHEELQGEEETDNYDSNSVALEHLRAVKPIIQASGDRKAIDDYNNAVRAIKNSRSTFATDSHTPAEFERRLRAEIDPDRSYEEMVRRAGARMRGEQVSETSSAAGRLRVSDADAPSMTDEGWGASMREAGRKMREKQR